MVFASESSDGILFVDASNAFNSLNRAVALRNILRICPVIAPTLINCYHGDAELFVLGKVLLSQEGTTQSHPLVMAMYALAIVCATYESRSHIRELQMWFADDASAGGKL